MFILFKKSSIKVGKRKRNLKNVHEFDKNLKEKRKLKPIKRNKKKEKK